MHLAFETTESQEGKMAERVSEVMNGEVLAFAATAPVRSTWDFLLEMGVSAAPVLDEDDHPVGIVSLRDLASVLPDQPLGAVMRAPAVIVSADATIAEAARLLDRGDLHHLVAVDASGRIAGFVSSLDLLRGLIGAPARHPATFPHVDREVGAVFTDDRPLDPEHIGDTPHAAGIVLLLRGGAGRPERVAWVESTDDIKAWLMRFFSQPLSIGDGIARPALGGGGLRYRYTVLDEAATRERVAFRLRERAQHAANLDVGH